MNIQKSIKNAIVQLGIDKLRNYQYEAITALLQKENVFSVLPTAAGKSLIYQVPQLVLQTGYTLVIEPTLALLYDQVQKLRAKGISAAEITSQNKETHPAILDDLRHERLSFLYITPEQLFRQDGTTPHRTKLLEILLDHAPNIVAVDEAHCITTWGNRSFRPAYANIGTFLELCQSHPPVAALTATAPHTYRDAIAQSPHMEPYRLITKEHTQKNISILTRDCSDVSLRGKLNVLKKTLKKYDDGSSVMIYCSTPKDVEAVTNFLTKHYTTEVCKYHAKLGSNTKRKNELDFLTDRKKIMVATSSFSMGVDKDDIRLVIHFNLPLSLIDYYQQIGRAGRDGSHSYAVLLYSEQDISGNLKILEAPLKQSENDPMIHQDVQASVTRFHEFLDVLHTNQCILQQIQAYFGYDAEKPCGRCTVCQKRRKKS